MDIRLNVQVSQGPRWVFQPGPARKAKGNVPSGFGTRPNSQHVPLEVALDGVDIWKVTTNVVICLRMGVKELENGFADPKLQCEVMDFNEHVVWHFNSRWLARVHDAILRSNGARACLNSSFLCLNLC